MSRKCEFTGRGAQFGNTRSKALNSTRRRWNINLQTITIIVDGKKQKVKLSSKVIRTLKNKGKI